MMANITVINTTEYIIASYIDFYISPILVVMGAVCNVLVVMVMQGRFFRNVSTSFYMSVNAITDIASLVIALPVHWLYVNYPWIFYRNRQFDDMCKFFNFFGWGSSDFGIILTVAMTTERAIAITLPLKASKWCTRKRARIVILSLLLVIIIKDLHFLFRSVIVPKDQTDLLCNVDLSEPHYHYFYTSVWPWVHNMFLLLSFSIIIISNLVIFKNVRKSGNSTVSGAGQKSVRNKTKLDSRGRQLSVMLIIDSFMIVACTVPFSIFTTFPNTLSDFGSSPQQQGLGKLLYGISFYLLYINRCANFYLYCVSGGRFRLALKQIVCCHRLAQPRRSLIGTVSRSSVNDESGANGRRNSQCTNTSDTVSNLPDHSHHL